MRLMLRRGHEEHPLAPVNIGFQTKPRYNTFDWSREIIYHSEYMTKKLAMNSDYSPQNKPPHHKSRFGKTSGTTKSNG